MLKKKEKKSVNLENKYRITPTWKELKNVFKVLMIIWLNFGNTT